jgi:hypothetical protein
MKTIYTYFDGHGKAFYTDESHDSMVWFSQVLGWCLDRREGYRTFDALDDALRAMVAE